jgi:nicotinamide-nucleotide amidase
VITTGGLGPTEDDVTREAVARATRRELVFRPDLLEDIERFFRARGLPLSPSNRKQAYIPRGAIPLPNPVGTAPCFIVEQDDRTLIVLPGVPREMEHLLLSRALPHLRARYGLQAAIVSRLVRVAGLGESRVGELLADLMAKGTNPTVGTMAHPGQIDVRIAAKGADEAAARALIVPVEAEVRARLGDAVFGTDRESLEGIVAGRLAERGHTLALVEVGTGGLLAERLTSVPGMAARLESLVASLEGTQRRLGTSSCSAAELAQAVRAWAGADVGAAVVMAAPEDDGPNPVHPTRIGIATSDTVREVEHRPGGDLRQVRLRVLVLALDGLRRALPGAG